jgi:uncharacterized protein (TIGR00299 family) protein
MSRVLWIDASVGVAGDMLLAALIDAGADVARIEAGLSRLGVPGLGLDVKETVRGAFRATKIEVRGAVEPAPDGVPGPRRPLSLGPVFTGHTHGPGGGHSHAGHGHSHAEPATADAAGARPPAVHRPYREVRAMIERAGLPDRARARALATYQRLAAAEARLHGVPLDDVELHEVGAVDAIADVVGTCLALEDLGVDTIVATPLPLGTGVALAAHGAIALPAPATVELARGWPVEPARWPGEWVTPTGAALVTTLGAPGGPPAMTVTSSGYGAGRRNPPYVANLTRVIVGEARAAAPGRDVVVELACNLDDFLPELVPPLVDRLLADGARDAWTAPVTMKHGRPALTLHALVDEADADRLSDVLLRHSSSLGVRRQTWDRVVLDRWEVVVDTAFGAVRVKVGGRGGEPWHASPEHRDVAAAALAHGVPPRDVHDAAVAAFHHRRYGAPDADRS